MALHPDPANWPATLLTALEQGLGLPLSGAALAQGAAARELREVLQVFDGDMWRDLRQETGGKLTLAAQARLKAWLANKEKPTHPQSAEGNSVVHVAMEEQPARINREEALPAIPTPAHSASGMVDLPALAMAHTAAEQAVAKQGSSQNFVWRVSPNGKLARSIVPASKLFVTATKPGKKLAEALCFGDFGANLQQLQGKRLAEHDCTVAVAALQHGAGCLLSILPSERATLQLEENHLASAMAQGKPRIFGQALLVCCWPLAPGQVHFGPMPKEACQDAVDASRRSTASKTGQAFGASKSASKRSDAAEPKGKEESSAEGVKLDERKKDQIKAILHLSRRQCDAQTLAPPGRARLPANASVNAAPLQEAPKADSAVELGKRVHVASPQAAQEAAASEEDDDWGPRWRAAVEKPVKRRRGLEDCEEVSQSALNSAALEAREAASPCSDGAGDEEEPQGLEQLLAPFGIEDKASAQQEEACDAVTSPCMQAGADEQRKVHLQQLLARARRVAHGCP